MRAREKDDAITRGKGELCGKRSYLIGARRIWRDVLEAGFSCGLHKNSNVSCALRLCGARPRRRALPRDDGERSASAIAPNVLDRQFTADQPNRKWIADFTYIWTAEGWLYVAAVVEFRFRARVAGWSMRADDGTRSSSLNASLMAVWRRGGPERRLLYALPTVAANTPASSSSG